MDNNIINIYDAQMAVNSSALAQFTAFVFNGIGVIKIPFLKKSFTEQLSLALHTGRKI